MTKRERVLAHAPEQRRELLQLRVLREPAAELEAPAGRARPARAERPAPAFGLVRGVVERLRDRERFGLEALFRGLGLGLDVAGRLRGAALEPPLGHARFAQAPLFQFLDPAPRLLRELGAVADLFRALDLLDSRRVFLLVAAKRELIDELAAREDLLGSEQLERALAEQQRREPRARHVELRACAKVLVRRRGEKPVEQEAVHARARRDRGSVERKHVVLEERGEEVLEQAREVGEQHGAALLERGERRGFPAQLLEPRAIVGIGLDPRGAARHARRAARFRRGRRFLARAQWWNSFLV